MYTAKIGNTTVSGTFAHLSATFEEYRDKRGVGISRFGKLPLVFSGENAIGFIAYNGRIFAGAEWKPGAEVLFDNRA